MPKNLIKKICLISFFTIFFLSSSLTMASEKPRLQDDYYAATNQEILDSWEIPDGEAYYGTITKKRADVREQLIQIISEYKEMPNISDEMPEKKALTLYENYMNYEERNAQGIAPLLPSLNEINAIVSSKDLIEFLKDGEVRLFNIQIGPDLKNSSMNILYILPPSLGMPDKTYYSQDDENSLAMKKAYIHYLKELFVLKGDSPDVASAKAKTVYDFETSIAPYTLTEEESFDFERTYNQYDIEKLNYEFPNLKIKEILKAKKLDHAIKIIVEEPDFLKAIDSAIQKNRIGTLKIYLESRLLLQNSNYLSSDFEEAWFEYQKAKYGIDKMKPLEDRALNYVNSMLPDILGKSYVEKYFSTEAKDDVTDIAIKIKEVYKKRIMALDWMGSATKENAIKKLDTMGMQIGYPAKLDDYSEVKILSYQDGGSLYSNLSNIANYNQNANRLSLNKVPDTDEWFLDAQSVNAGYMPDQNKIIFPAGILSPPLYSHEQSYAKNLGSIGAIIGHEISHAFDENCSKFDENGNLRNWWTDEDHENFKERTRRIAEDFSELEIFPGIHVNGNLTLGENIADLGGLTASLEILQTTSNPDYDEFFRAWSTTWASKCEDELIKYLIKIDSHSPDIFRVNQTLRYLDQFHKTYETKPGDRMYLEPEKRVKIW